MIDAKFDQALRDAIARCTGAGAGPREMRRLKAIVGVALYDEGERHREPMRDSDAARLARRVALRHVVQAADDGVRIRVDVDPGVRLPVGGQDILEALLECFVLRAISQPGVSQVVIQAVVPESDEGALSFDWSVIDDGVSSGTDAEFEDCMTLARRLGAELRVDGADADGTTITLKLASNTG